MVAINCIFYVLLFPILLKLGVKPNRTQVTFITTCFDRSLNFFNKYETLENSGVFYQRVLILKKIRKNIFLGFFCVALIGIAFTYNNCGSIETRTNETSYDAISSPQLVDSEQLFEKKYKDGKQIKKQPVQVVFKGTPQNATFEILDSQVTYEVVGANRIVFSRSEGSLDLSCNTFCAGTNCHGSCSLIDNECACRPERGRGNSSCTAHCYFGAVQNQESLK